MKLPDDLDARIVEIQDRFQSGSERVIALVTTDHPHWLHPTSMAAEAIRASLVLQHAYIEDFTRQSALLFLPEWSKAALARVPLYHSSGVSQAATRRRPQKFSLGDLVEHRDTTVEELIRISVSRWLSRRTFNSVADIARFFKVLGFDLKLPKALRDSLNSLIARRHVIVHSADINHVSGDLNSLDMQMITLSVFASKLYPYFVYAAFLRADPFPVLPAETLTIYKNFFDPPLPSMSVKEFQDHVIKVFDDASNAQ